MTGRCERAAVANWTSSSWRKEKYALTSGTEVSSTHKMFISESKNARVGGGCDLDMEQVADVHFSKFNANETRTRNEY